MYKISTDARLWLIKEVYNIKELINKLLINVCERAEKEIQYIMPGNVKSYIKLK